MTIDIDGTEAQWVLGMLPPERLPDIAVSALQNGLDSDALRILAGLSGSEIDDASKLFEEALKSLGRGQMSKKDAVRLYARTISGQILRGEMEPYAGAKKIWEAALKASEPEFHEVDPFIYAASEYEDRPEDHKFFNNAIRKEAQRWVLIPGSKQGDS